MIRNPKVMSFAIEDKEKALKMVDLLLETGYVVYMYNEENITIVVEYEYQDDDIASGYYVYVPEEKIDAVERALYQDEDSDEDEEADGQKKDEGAYKYYTKGRTDGYQVGYNAGYQKRMDEEDTDANSNYDAGYSEGYDKGYSDGLSDLSYDDDDE